MSNLKRLSLTLFLIIVAVTNLFGQMNIRSADELLADTSGWTSFLEMTKVAKNKIEVLPANKEKAKEALYQLQVTTHSYLGAIVYFTGGVFIKDGLLRLLGSGSEKIKRSLPEWNKGKSFSNYGEQPKFVLFADDALGGFFAINGGGLGTDLGKVYYLAPDALKWESLDVGHSQFIEFCLNGDIDEFYEDLNWKDREQLLKSVSGDRGISFFPFLWTKEGKDLQKVSRKAVPMQELYDMKTN